jgi:sialate O-acetylesterase
MIHPLTPYKVKGFLWYQGESNVGDARKYEGYMRSMVETWRTYWGEELPFYFVQIAPYKYTGVLKSESAELRYAQFLAQKSIKNSGMVVTLDIGEVNNIHPGRKREVGQRLANWALAKNYGKPYVCTGPTYQSQKVEGTRIRLTFENIGRGLEMKGKVLKGFEIAGADKKYVEATAVIENNTVLVYSDKVVKPMYVRYAWYNGSEASLFNVEGLPASTFMTE